MTTQILSNLKITVVNKMLTIYLLFVVTPKKAERKDCLVYLEVSQDWSRVFYDAHSSVLQLSVVQLV